MSNYPRSEPVIRRSELPGTELHGETVLLSLEQQSYYGLRSTSQRIWQLLEQPCTLQQILDALLLEYDVERQQCEREVGDFMQRLWDAQLIAPIHGAQH
jgi:hypothetical protein